jgi:hypothetical protein
MNVRDILQIWTVGERRNEARMESRQVKGLGFIFWMRRLLL